MLLGGDKKVDPRMHWKAGKSLVWLSFMIHDFVTNLRLKTRHRAIEELGSRSIGFCGKSSVSSIFSWQARTKMHPSTHLHIFHIS